MQFISHFLINIKLISAYNTIGSPKSKNEKAKPNVLTFLLQFIFVCRLWQARVKPGSEIGGVGVVWVGWGT